MLHRQLLMGEAIFVGDTAWVFYALRALGAARLQAGEIGAWNPHLFGGLPFAADPQSQVFYPFHLLLLPLSVPDAMSVSLALHYLLMLIGTYLLARHCLRVVPIAAAFCALAFSFSGPALMRSSNPAYVDALTWMPWALLTLHWALQGRVPVRFVAPVTVLALQLCTGAPQYSYYTLLLMAGLSLWHLLQATDARERLRPALWLAAVVAAAGALAAIQLLPAVEMARLSNRTATWSYEEATTYSLPVAKYLHTLLYPQMYGAAEAPELEFFALSSHLGYVGAATLCLTLVALVASPRRRAVAWLLGLVVLSLFLGAARHNPVYPLLYEWLPGLSLFRCPAAIIVVTCLALSSLAALGLAALVSGRLRGRPLAIAVAIVPAAAGLLMLGSAAERSNSWLLLLHPSWPLNQFAMLAASSLLVVAVVLVAGSRRHRLHRYMLLACLPLLAVDLTLFSLDTDLALTLPNYRLLREPETVQFFRRQPGLFRVWDMTGGMPLRYHLQGATVHGEDRLRCRSINAAGNMETLVSGLTAAFQLDGLNGAWGAMLPLARHVPGLYRQKYGDTQLQWLDLLNVRYFTNVVEREPDPLQALRRVWDTNVQIVVWERPDALPRAFLAATAVPVADAAEAIASIETQVPFPHDRIVCLEGPLHGQGPLQADGSGATRSVAGTVTWLQYHPERLVLQVRSDGDSWLVISDNYYPGWRAEVDGRPATVYPANAVMRAVAVPGGEHRVVLQYIGSALLTGTFITLCAIGGLCGLLSYHLLSRKASRSA